MVVSRRRRRRMSPTYVQAQTRKMVDFDRVRPLMDQELLRQCYEEMGREQAEYPRDDARYGPWWIFECYCSRHHDKYGEPFRPDVDPNWDQGA
jgi:hypothetical protein